MDALLGTATIRIGEIIGSTAVTARVPLIKSGHVGILNVTAEFVKESLVGST